LLSNVFPRDGIDQDHLLNETVKQFATVFWRSAIASKRKLVEVVVEIVSADGTLIDLHEHYGEPAPQLYVTEARGVAKDVQVMDFNGKWVLVYMV
jgi:hypothetical protein